MTPISELRLDGPSQAAWTLVLAHGAGQGMDSPFMSAFAEGLAARGKAIHPPGKPEQLRTDSLKTLRTPTLICQGSRDPFGSAEEVPGYELSDAIRLHWLEDGEHSFKPRKSSGCTEADNRKSAIKAIIDFLTMLNSDLSTYTNLQSMKY